MVHVGSFFGLGEGEGEFAESLAVMGEFQKSDFTFKIPGSETVPRYQSTICNMKSAILPPVVDFPP